MQPHLPRIAGKINRTTLTSDSLMRRPRSIERERFRQSCPKRPTFASRRIDEDEIKLGGKNGL